MASNPPRPTRFVRLTALNVLATLTVPLASLVDTAMLGHLPVATALAGAALGGLVFDYIFWGLGFLRMATTGLAAGATGRDDRDECSALLWRASLLGFGLGLGLVLLRPLILVSADLVLPGEAPVVAAANDYVGARLWGAPATLANFALTGWLLGTGRSGRALLLASVANLSNAGLNVVFIWGLGLDAAGAGYATACGQWLALCATVPTLWPIAGPRPLRATVLDRNRIGELFSLGGDITIRTVCLVTAMSLFTGAGALFSPAILAAQAVLMRVLGLFSYVIDGAAQAVETMGGQAFAAGRRDHANVVIWWGHGISVFVALGLGAALWLFPTHTVGLLTDIEPVRAHATAWLGPTIAVAFVGGFAYIYDGLFVGIAGGKTLRNAMLLSFGLGFLPVFGYAVAVRSLEALWASLLIFMAVRATSLAWAWASIRSERADGGDGGSSPRVGPPGVGDGLTQGGRSPRDPGPQKRDGLVDGAG